MTHKPTVEALGIDPGAQAWQRSGAGDGAIEIAFARMPVKVGGAEGAGSPGTQAESAGGRGPWVLMRVAGDPDGRILVFDRHEWECFLDGARNGEFDDAAEMSATAPSQTPCWPGGTPPGPPGPPQPSP